MTGFDARQRSPLDSLSTSLRQDQRPTYPSPRVFQTLERIPAPGRAVDDSASMEGDRATWHSSDAQLDELPHSNSFHYSLYGAMDDPARPADETFDDPAYEALRSDSPPSPSRVRSHQASFKNFSRPFPDSKDPNKRESGPQAFPRALPQRSDSLRHDQRAERDLHTPVPLSQWHAGSSASPHSSPRSMRSLDLSPRPSPASSSSNVPSAKKAGFLGSLFRRPSQVQARDQLSPSPTSNHSPLHRTQFQRLNIHPSHSQGRDEQGGLATSPSLRPGGTARHATLDEGRLSRPEERPLTTTSMYSGYSFYALPDEQESLGNDDLPRPRHAPTSSVSSTLQKSKVGLAPPPVKLSRTKSGREVINEHPETAEDFLQLGIVLHEAGELERAAHAFERSAREGGGCGMGYLLWGLTLRHGWGCHENQPLGFQYLERAAQSVVHDLDRLLDDPASMDTDTKATRHELVLALHEIGTSYRFGWGIEKDKKQAVRYWLLAANLGDPDAQLDVAFAYEKGKGCTKDLKTAAKYYRMAAAQQGIAGSGMGLSWIYKEKYLE